MVWSMSDKGGLINDNGILMENETANRWRTENEEKQAEEEMLEEGQYEFFDNIENGNFLLRITKKLKNWINILKTSNPWYIYLTGAQIEIYLFLHNALKISSVHHNCNYSIQSSTVQHW